MRVQQELASFTGHNRDVISAAWHPLHEELFVSGGYDGSLIFWLAGRQAPQVGGWVWADVDAGESCPTFSLPFPQPPINPHPPTHPPLPSRIPSPFPSPTHPSTGRGARRPRRLRVGPGCPFIPFPHPSPPVLAPTPAQAEVRGAHDGSVWGLAWHPAGHLLASGAADGGTKFWCRSRPGDPFFEQQQAQQEELAAMSAAAGGWWGRVSRLSHVFLAPENPSFHRSGRSRGSRLPLLAAAGGWLAERQESVCGWVIEGQQMG